MRTALETLRGGIDIVPGSDLTSDGRRILSAKICLVRDPESTSNGTRVTTRTRYRPQVEMMVHDKTSGRVHPYALVMIDEGFDIPAEDFRDDEPLEDWIHENVEIARRVSRVIGAANRAVETGRVTASPRDSIYDVASRIDAPEADADDAA